MNKTFTAIIFLIILFIFTISCNQNKTVLVTREDSVTMSTVYHTKKDSVNIGKLLFDSSCIGCHSIRLQIIGPPLKNYSDRGGVFVNYSEKVKEHQILKVNKTQLKFIDVFIRENTTFIDP